MKLDYWTLYRHMLRSRLFEQQVRDLWNQGKISGEMHLAIGEEAISAGIVGQIQDGDALALDHRGTPQLLMRGIDPVLLLLEFMGHAKGLCSGMGGHMHLHSKKHLAASSGIVGASCPAAVGFAFANQYLRPGHIAVAFFGEGAINQGMVMESFNLACVWKLPVVFVCKDNQWSITTPSRSVTGGRPVDRARSFGIIAEEIDGGDIDSVWHTSRMAMERARRGEGSSFIHMRCFRPEGHFLGDPLIRIARNPIKGMKPLAGPLIKSITRRKGSSMKIRSESLYDVVTAIGSTIKSQIGKKEDPLKRIRDILLPDKEKLEQLEQNVDEEIQKAVNTALEIINQKSGEMIR